MDEFKEMILIEAQKQLERMQVFHRILKFLLIAGLVFSPVAIVQAETNENMSIAEIQEMLKTLMTAMQMATEVQATAPNPFDYLNEIEKMELASREAERQRIKTLAGDSGLDEECLFRQEATAIHTKAMEGDFNWQKNSAEEQLRRIIKNMSELPESAHEQLATSIAQLEQSIMQLNIERYNTAREAERIRRDAFTKCRKNAE